jgi:putative membrane protein
MRVLMWLAAALAGVIHVAIFFMESVWWTAPAIQRRFRTTPEQSAATRLFAFNQGFYNLFLALGTFGGLALVLAGQRWPGMLLISWNCLSMVSAALVLSVSAPELRRGAVIQGGAPLVFLVLTILSYGR